MLLHKGRSLALFRFTRLAVMTEGHTSTGAINSESRGGGGGGVKAVFKRAVRVTADGREARFVALG